MKQLPTLPREFLGYLLASLVALCVDLGLLMSLHYGLNLPVWLATAIGFTAGIGVIYHLSVSKVFQHRRYEDKTSFELLWFLITGLLGLAFSVIMVPLLANDFAWPVILAKAVTVGFVFTFNFTARKLVLFTKKVSA